MKPVFYNGTDEEKGISYRVIREVLIKSLKLLHPTMPFITEEIYSFLNDEETIMKAPWPEAEKMFMDPAIEDTMSGIIEAIKSIRNLRAEMNVPNKRKTMLNILPNSGKEEAFKSSRDYLMKLAYAEDITLLEKAPEEEGSVTLVTSTAKIYIPLLDLVDREKELERLEKEKQKLQSEIERVSKKLNNEKFLANAKEDVVQEERAKGEKYQSMLDAVLERIGALS